MNVILLLVVLRRRLQKNRKGITEDYRFAQFYEVSASGRISQLAPRAMVGSLSLLLSMHSLCT